MAYLSGRFSDVEVESVAVDFDDDVSRPEDEEGEDDECPNQEDSRHQLDPFGTGWPGGLPEQGHRRRLSHA
jgi:hypothetical protein